MIIRVYALYGRNRRILWFMFGIGMCVVVVTVVRGLSAAFLQQQTHFSIRSRSSTLLDPWFWEGVILN
jgi:hypothetical protein